MSRPDVVYGRPRGWHPLTEVAEFLGVSARSVLGFIYRGPLLAAWRSGELMVNEDHLAQFVAQRRSW